MSLSYFRQHFECKWNASQYSLYGNSGRVLFYDR